MGGSGKEETPVTLEAGGEKLSENHSELKSHKHKKKKDDKEHELDGLKKKLEEKEKEAKESLDRLLRIAADFENYKKRAAREKEDWTKFSNEDLIKSILPFIDNLERAADHAEKVTDTGVLIEGIKLTLRQIHQTLNRFGLTPFESVGKPFDPARHEAMLVVETDRHEPDQVVEEFQRGYFLNERLLRPATVSVSKSPSKETQITE
ncbi:MAG: nucleotide exchange factor GrpE [Deltaproteobacteria bacterium]|nr:nucleotide exchange factor GrpE [Deltaproteobacteria bacterium]